jgi:hypothetical protein
MPYRLEPRPGALAADGATRSVAQPARAAADRAGDGPVLRAAQASDVAWPGLDLTQVPTNACYLSDESQRCLPSLEKPVSTASAGSSACGSYDSAKYSWRLGNGSRT